jgi:hypothetical protein
VLVQLGRTRSDKTKLLKLARPVSIGLAGSD